MSTSYSFQIFSLAHCPESYNKKLFSIPLRHNFGVALYFGRLAYEETFVGAAQVKVTEIASLG